MRRVKSPAVLHATADAVTKANPSRCPGCFMTGLCLLYAPAPEIGDDFARGIRALGALVTPPPGCVPDPHMYSPFNGPR